jgi:hypothetical protein
MVCVWAGLNWIGALPLISSIKSKWFDIAEVLIRNKWVLEVDETV